MSTVPCAESGHCRYLGLDNSQLRGLWCVLCDDNSTLSLSLLDVVSCDPNCDSLKCFCPEAWGDSLLLCV